jgi:peptidyl-prolyl cis-trans isomerase A (cyclophilin A)
MRSTRSSSCSVSSALACGALALAAPMLVGCKRAPSEPTKDNTAASAAIPVAPAAPAMSMVPAAEGDPAKGRFSVEEAAAGLDGKGALLATIETTKGTLHCTLFGDKAPVTVANFAGLARGLRPWKQGRLGSWVKKPFYDGLTFHRVIPGFVIQGGDPNGNGSGDAGYEFIDEVWQGAKHDRAGLLCMANRGPNTNSSQFFITDGSTPHLDGGYTIFGECKETDVVHAIAAVPARMERPSDAVSMTKVTIARAP